MAATGFLIVRTYASNAQLPVTKALVTVSRMTGEGPQLLATRITDENGRIQPISIETPERNDSLTPGFPRPFTDLELLVEHPDYDRVLIENLQIFPNVITQQDIVLLPRSELPEAYNLTELVEIPAQDL